MTAAAETVRGNIPLLQKSGEHYLDNAATALMPQTVLQAVANYNAETRANVGRGLHNFAEAADEQFAQARATVAAALSAKNDEIVFTSGATAGLNLLANALGQTVAKNGAVALSLGEHHSNIVPWQIAARRGGFAIRFFRLAPNGAADLEEARRIIRGASVVAVAHAYNVSGAVNDISALAQIAKENGAKFVVDGAQYIPHGFAAPEKLGADFYVFSGHKCYAPNGIGVLWGRKKSLAELPDAIGGGGSITEVCEKGFSAAEPPRRLEAGTPPISQTAGLAAAIAWMQNIPQAAKENARNLAQSAREELAKIPGARVLFSGGGENAPNVPIVSFVVEGAHPHDCCQILAERGVAVRGGHHCAQPLMRALGISGCVRASFAPYNNDKDLRALVAAAKEAAHILRR